MCEASRCQQLGQHHHRPLGEDHTIPFLRAQKQCSGCRKQRIFRLARGEWVIAMADSGWIKDKDWPKARAIASCRGKQLTFNFVDNDRVAPREELADGEESLTRACWANNQQIAEFFTDRRGLHREDLALPVDAQQQALLRKCLYGEGSNFLTRGKAGGMESGRLWQPAKERQEPLPEGEQQNTEDRRF